MLLNVSVRERDGDDDDGMHATICDFIIYLVLHIVGGYLYDIMA